MIIKYYHKISDALDAIPNHVKNRPLFFEKECRWHAQSMAWLIMGLVCVAVATTILAACLVTSKLLGRDYLDIIYGMLSLFGAGTFLLFIYAATLHRIYRRMQAVPSVAMLDWLRKLSVQENLMIKEQPKTKQEFARYVLQAYVIREQRMKEAGVAGVFKEM